MLSLVAELSLATVALASSICGVVPRLSPRVLEKNLDLTRNLTLFMVGFAVWEMAQIQMDDQGRLRPAQFHGGMPIRKSIAREGRMRGVQNRHGHPRECGKACKMPAFDGWEASPY